MSVWGRGRNRGGKRLWCACLALVVAFTVAWPGLLVYASDGEVAPVAGDGEPANDTAQADGDVQADQGVSAEEVVDSGRDAPLEGAPMTEGGPAETAPLDEQETDGEPNGATGCIAVYKFRDDDRDEHKDPWEPWVEGWEFTLYDSKGVFIESATTNEHGELCFSSVPVGKYLVRETLRDGWINVTPQNQEVHVLPWQTSHLWFANAFQTGCIAVYKFQDDDRDEHKDPEEQWLEGWEFTLYDSEGTFVASGTTNEHGELCFSSVPVGENTVRETLRDGWVNVTPLSQAVRVCDWQTTHVWFANAPEAEAPETGDLVVRKFEDLDEDGTWDEGEPLLEGWDFTVYDAQDVQIGTGTTDANGWIMWEGLPEGEVTVVETLETGWVNTTPISQTTTIVGGETAFLFFGNVAEVLAPETGNVLIHKFLDDNENGVLDTGEQFLSGWSFVVRDGAGAVVATGSTNTAGELAFELPVGAYTVTETLAAGWTNTTALTQNFTVVAGQTAHVFFGNAESFLPFTPSPTPTATPSEPFLPFTGGEYGALIAAALGFGLAGAALRRRPHR